MQVNAAVSPAAPIPLPSVPPQDTAAKRGGSRVRTLPGGLPRRLPAVLRPAVGEAFASWIDRLAWQIGIAPGDAVRVLGLECRQVRSATRPLFFGIALTETSAHRASVATGLTAGELAGMQLAAFDGGALDFTGLDLTSERSVTPLVHREWALFTGSRACPRCLVETPVWPLWWRLGTAAVCPRHRVLLIDSCPGCGIRLRGGYARRGRGLISRALGVDPGRCNNHVRPESGGTSRLCDQLLGDLPSVAVPDALVEAQRGALRAADGKPRPVAGQAVDAAEWFGWLRFACALVRFAAPAQDTPALAGLTDQVTAAFAAYQQRQEPGVQEDRGGLRTRVQQSPPTAAHAAALLAITQPLLVSPTVSKVSQWLGSWLDAAGQVRQANPYKTDPLRLVPRPERLETLIAPLRSSPYRVSGALRARPGLAGVRPANIPHLLDHGDYQDLIASHLPGTAPLTGRRLAALALARLTGAGSWAEAAAVLGMDAAVAARIYGAVVKRVPGPDAFWDAVREAGARMRSRGLVDYAARRAALANLTEVPHAVLFPVCHRLGRPVTPQRRRHAAAWLWQHLTSGDIREAPAYASNWPGATTASIRDGARRFAAWIPTSVAQALTAWGDHLLTEGSA
ncbi:TniQ protein [Streptomyces aidingensis]|uniref:TniQ protein n=1 Tax=Streptomyces aidingensis TaxID=910347 RepID=A0A1I1NVY2_9ACTN|nr:TniQ protein [Streptomyces aidingensis]